MAAATPAVKVPPAFELKSATLNLLALTLKTADLALLAEALQRQTADAPALYEHEAVVVDLSQVQPAAVQVSAESAATDVDDEADVDVASDLSALLSLLRSHGLVPVGIRGGSGRQMAAALAAGLVDAPDIAPAPARLARPEPRVARGPEPEPVAAPAVAASEPDPVPPSEAESPVPAAGSAAAAAHAMTTMYVSRPLRSGQQVYARGGDLVMLAAVNDGAEVIADGSIHVYAPLRGRAVAGARGDADARIFATHMQPQLVSIAGTYLTIDADLAPDVKGRPAQVRLEAGRLVFEPLGRISG